MEADLYFTESCNSGLAYGQTQHDLASTRPIRPPGPGKSPRGCFLNRLVSLDAVK